MLMGNSLVLSIVILLILNSIIVPFVVTLRTSECPCGYGGVCLNIEGLCHLCEQVSGGWYEKDCFTIVDYCAKKPCARGRCVSTFGSYYCECPAHYMGMNCDIYVPTNAVPSNKVSLYYQLHARPTQRAALLVLFEAEEWEFKQLKYRWTIKVSDGREFYPGLLDFVYTNAYERCEEETGLYPEIYDPRICHLLPKRSVLTFEFYTYLSIPLTNRENLIFADGSTEPIGRLGYVTIQLQAVTADYISTVYSGNYTILYYLHSSRIYGNCNLEFRFFECSDNVKYPDHHGRGDLIEITSIKSHSWCQGTRILQKDWYLQSLVEGKQNPVPLLLDGEHHDTLALPRFSLSTGLYMIAFEYTLQGTPPHFGSQRVFKKIGHCWISSDEGPADVHLEGGNIQTASCFRPLRIPLINENRNAMLNDMTFFISCDNSDDKECDFVYSEVPILKRRRLVECGSVYRYAIFVDTRGASLIIEATITFVPVDVVLGIKCIQNCNPINPAFKSTWVAYTRPYIPGSVNWSITVSGKHFEKENIAVKSFYPAMATRIFVMRANVFNEYSEVKMYLQVSHGDLNVTTNPYIDNVEPTLKHFTLERVQEAKGIRYRYKSTDESKGELKEWKEWRYRIFMIDKTTTGAIWIVSTNYQELLEFDPFWGVVCLCIQTIGTVNSCSSLHNVEVNEEAAKATSMTELTGLFTLGQIGICLRRADYLIWKSIIPTDPEIPVYKWQISVKERNMVVNLIRKVLSKHTAQTNLITILHMFSMIFYSFDGNRYEELPLFYEELNDKSDIATAIEWVQLRQDALMILKSVAETIEYQSGVDAGEKRLQIPFGDFLERFMVTYSLACAQGTSYIGLTQQVKNSDMFSGLISYYTLMNHKVLEDIILKFVGAIANYMVLYDGVNKYGMNYAVLWSTNDSYAGLLHALNKSEPGEGLKFFGSSRPGFHWFNRIELELPPAPYQLRFKELTLTVVATKPHKFDDYASCSLVILLRTKNEKYMKELPNNLKYRVTLPTMLSGEFWNITNDLKKFKDVIERKDIDETSRKSRHFFFHAYKISFPWKFEKFTLLIFQSEGIPLKALVNFDQVPNYEDVMDSPDLILIPDKHFSFVSEVEMQRNMEDQYLPKTIYVGVLPSNKLRVGERINIFFFTTLLLCRTQDLEDKGDIDDCQQVLTETLWYHDSEIICDCKKLGVTGVFVRQLRIVRFLMSDELFYFDIVHYRSNNFILVCIETVILVLLAAIPLVVARVWDVKHRRQEHVIYTWDCFRSNTSLLVIGVYTGHRIGAGTMSSVAVQLAGQKSFTKVFLLKRTKYSNRTTLQRGQDDWFVVTTKEHIGKINAVHIWINFHCISPWYCTEMLIYDATTYQWFRTAVNRWFKISDPIEKLRVVKYEVHEYQAIESFDSLGFINSYVVELENTHQTISIYKIHPRGLYTHEHRTSIFVVKLLIMCCWTWCTMEIVIYLLIGEYLDAEDTKLFIDLRMKAFLISVFISVMSTLSVTPLEALYRLGHLQRMIQKKTTNPLILYAGKDSRTSRSSSRGSTHLDTKSHTSRQSKTGSRYGRNASVSTSIANLSVRNTKKVHYCSWTFIKAMYVSPCQFYWVNANTDTVNFTMRYTNAIARLSVTFSLLMLFAAVMFSLWGTKFMMKANTAGFLVITAFLVDVFIVNPIFILIRTLVMFYGLRVSNKEETILNEETPFSLRNKIPHSEYLSIAIGKDYKPLLSTEIEKLKAKEIYMRFALESLFFFLIIAAAGLCMKISGKVSDQLIFYDVKAISELAADHEITEGGLVFSEKGIDAINGPFSASSYISNNLLNLARNWYSGKPISMNNNRWARDYNAQPVDATLTLFVLQSNTTTQRVPDLFNEYYTAAFGYLFESDLHTKPVIMDRIRLHFKTIYSGTFRGKSGEFFKLEGYNLTGPTSGDHISRIRYTLEQLDTRINVTPLRAMIVSVNFINGFTKNIITADLLVEFDPSGICSAVLMVNSSMIEPRNTFVVDLYALIIICIIIFIIVIVSFHYSYLDRIWKKIVGFLTLIYVLMVVHRDSKRTYDVVDQIKYNPVDAYLDLQEFHDKKVLSAFSLKIFPCLVLLHTVWIIRSLIGTPSFRTMLLKYFHYSFIFYLLGIVLVQIMSVCVYHDIGLITAMMNYCTKSIRLTDELKNFGVACFIFFAVVIHKIGFALVAYLYIYKEIKFHYDETNLFVQFMRTFNKRKSASSLSKKEQTHGHGGMKRKSSPSRKDTKTKKSVGKESPPLDEKPPESQLNEKAYRPTSLLNKKIGLFDDNTRKT